MDFEIHEYVHMNENMGELMLKEIWRLAEDQVSFCYPGSAECEISVTSKQISITFLLKMVGRIKA